MRMMDVAKRKREREKARHGRNRTSYAPSNGTLKLGLTVPPWTVRAPNYAQRSTVCVIRRLRRLANWPFSRNYAQCNAMCVIYPSARGRPNATLGRSQESQASHLRAHPLASPRLCDEGRRGSAVRLRWLVSPLVMKSETLYQQI